MTILNNKIIKEGNIIEKIKKNKNNYNENKFIPLLIFQKKSHHWLSKDYFSINYCLRFSN